MENQQTKRQTYYRLRGRYWTWLEENWSRILAYQEDRNNPMQMYPAFGSGSTRFTDVSAFSREFERYLETPAAIRDAARVATEMQRKYPRDFAIVQLAVRGLSDERIIGELVLRFGSGRNETNFRKRKRLAFEYFFSRLPNEFIQPLKDADIIGADSRERSEAELYQRAAGGRMMPYPPTPVETLQQEVQELHELFRPDFLPWMLRLDTEEGQDREEFNKAYPHDTEDGSRIRRFGAALTRYKKRRQLASYKDALGELALAV